MAVIMAHALDNSLAKRIMTLTGDWYLPSTAPVEKVKATWLTDRFGGKATLDTVTVKGAKTGWETSPGACLVSYAQSNGGGKEYVMVIVGGNGLSAKSSTSDVKNIYKEYAR
jgi:D-alanyl-D-alanine carboxypeptidase